MRASHVLLGLGSIVLGVFVVAGAALTWPEARLGSVFLLEYSLATTTSLTRIRVDTWVEEAKLE